MNKPTQPSRRDRLRWRDRDYSLPGPYFVTACTHDRVCRFGSIRRGEMLPTPLGRFAIEALESLPSLMPTVALDHFVVMPNHVHAIIVLQHRAPSAEDRIRLGSVVGAFKSRVGLEWVRMAVAADGAPPVCPLWQRGYHDRVIRDAKEWDRVRAYIDGNVAAWEKDHHFTLG